MKASSRVIGFAKLGPEQRRALGAKGGAAAQAKGTGHRWDSEGAREAAYRSPRKKVKRRRQQPS